MNQTNSHEIERYAKLTDVSINIYKNEMTAKVTPKRTIMKIPLMYIQSISLMADYGKFINSVQGQKSFATTKKPAINTKQSNRAFFKIILD